MTEWTLTALSILGTWLNIKKKTSCWLVWAVANIGWVVSFAIKGMAAEATLFLVYLGLSIYGWFQWREASAER